MAESRDILTGSLAGKTIGDGLIVLPGQGNSLAACTDDGVVVLDVLLLLREQICLLQLKQ